MSDLEYYSLLLALPVLGRLLWIASKAFLEKARQRQERPMGRRAGERD